MAMAAIGGLMKKIARQETSWVRNPPTTGPIARARALTPAQVPIAVPRCSGGNAWVMIERVAGIMNAAPIPWAARNATSAVSLGAKPIARLAMPKATTPNRNIRRRPKMSPRRPPVTIITAKVSVYALTVHSSADSEACRPRWIEGSATFTTVLSSITMNSAKHIAPSVHQRLFSSVINRCRWASIALVTGVQSPVGRQAATSGRVSNVLRAPASASRSSMVKVAANC